MRQPLTPMSHDMSPRSRLHSSPLEPRRQTMSNQELTAFDDMFNIVFSAANERRLAEDGAAGAFDVDTRTPLSDFLKNLSKRPRVRQKGEDTELDRLKEQLALCQSDHAMLEWAEREVFGASIRAEEAVRAAVTQGKPPPPHLQPPLYPQLLATLMSTAREGYDDPNLALALFEHARNLSPLSYIFGCTTPAYNELLETRWHSFRDLRGVHTALEEMRANGVSPDLRTRALVDDVRNEVGARTVWLEESETGSGEVWTMLREIERLVARRAPRQASSDDYRAFQGRSRPHDEWKNPELTSDESAGYRFGEWPEPERRRRPRQRALQSS
jgi:hypothetical protein